MSSCLLVFLSFEVERNAEYQKRRNEIWDLWYPDVEELSDEQVKKLNSQSMVDAQNAMKIKYGAMWDIYVKDYYAHRKANK